MVGEVVGTRGASFGWAKWCRPLRRPCRPFDAVSCPPLSGTLCGRGTPRCSFCLGIGDFHTGGCETNKEKRGAWLARKKKLTDGTPNMPGRKLARRAGHQQDPGICEIQRSNLREQRPAGAAGGRELGGGFELRRH